MSIDVGFLKSVTETPSVGTACQPMVNLLTRHFGGGFQRTLVPDGFCLFQKQGAQPEDLRIVFVAHVDEIGGCTYGARTQGGYQTRVWGADPALFSSSKLQAFDYLAEEPEQAFPVAGTVVETGGELRLVLDGDNIRPYRTVFTFDTSSTIDNYYVSGKAVDPRATAFSVAEAVRQLDSPAVGAVFVFAEECAMDLARKAVTFLDRRAPDLQLVVNADVPSIANLGDASLDMPAIRIFEGRNFIDPSFGIRVVDALQTDNVQVHLSAARSGSQTLLFTPLAPTLSIALPGEDIHTARGRMSLIGIERCTTLMTAIAERQLRGVLTG